MTLDSDLPRQLEIFNVHHNVQNTAHRTVLSYLHIEPPRPATEAARRSRGWAKDSCKEVQSVSDYQSAIADMIARDLLWEIDATKQSLIRDYLNSAPALGPTDGIPTLGTLQISIRFANLLDEFWANVDGERPEVLWSRDWQSDKLHLVYSPTRNGCLDFLRDELTDDEDYPIKIERLSGPNLVDREALPCVKSLEMGFVLDVHFL